MAESPGSGHSAFGGWFFSSIGGRGDKVDVAWVSDDGAVKYARSSDGGQSFADPKTIASVNHSGGATSIARGPNGLVAIAWVQNSWTGKTRARVSTDGGYSFGAAQTIATGTEYVGLKVAVGNGTVYVASVKGPTLSIRRSTDGGASWTTPQVISGDTTDDFSITVEGSDAYVAYPSDGLRYRHTSDNGAHWSSELQLLKPNLDLIHSGRDSRCKEESCARCSTRTTASSIARARTASPGRARVGIRDRLRGLRRLCRTTASRLLSRHRC